MGEQIDIDRAGGFSFVREAYDWIESSILAIVCMLLLFTFVARIVSVDGRSMLPTLQHADRLISSAIGYEPTYGDIVVVTMPNTHHEPLVKRVIATGGQEIDIDFSTGIVYVDNIPLAEPYTQEPTYNQFDMDFPQTVPEGHVFVMGDNRNHSSDSRDSSIGMVDQRYLLGRVLYRVAPWDHMGVPE